MSFWRLLPTFLISTPENSCIHFHEFFLSYYMRFQGKIPPCQVEHINSRNLVLFFSTVLILIKKQNKKFRNEFFHVLIFDYTYDFVSSATYTFITNLWACSMFMCLSMRTLLILKERTVQFYCKYFWMHTCLVS